MSVNPFYSNNRTSSENFTQTLADDHILSSAYGQKIFSIA